MLMVALFIVVLMVVLGFAFLTSSSGRYAAATRMLASAQARALAEAGMEDVRLKLQRDWNFPPSSSLDQTQFGYSEEVRELGTSRRVGSYQVRVDFAHQAPPYGVIRVWSTGTLGQDPRLPYVNYTIYAEFDSHPDASHDATRFRYVNWSEEAQNP